jgi:hypothetical protein
MHPSGYSAVAIARYNVRNVTRSDDVTAFGEQDIVGQSQRFHKITCCISSSTSPPESMSSEQIIRAWPGSWYVFCGGY